MSYKAIIIDDEQVAIEMIAFHLNKHFSQIEIVAKVTTIKEGIEKIKELNPDILFLDIELKEGSGFEIREATKNQKYQLIFSTAYTQYAIKAFKANALEYILKPIDESDFCTSVNKAIEVLRLKFSNNASKKILFNTHEGAFYVLPEEIIYLKSDSNYTNIYMKNGKAVLVSKTLKELEQMLSAEYFIRVHNSYIINHHLITGYQRGDGGFLFLNGNIQIPVSRSRKEAVSRFLNESI